MKKPNLVRAHHLGSNDQSYITNTCNVGKKHVSTSCDDLLDMPCSSQLDACSTSMSCETNLLKENNCHTHLTTKWSACSYVCPEINHT
jgi:hypothetical protein